MPHIHDLIDHAVDVYVVFNGKVLLRRHDKYKIWLGPGGHIELNEDPNQAAIRETKEEVGLDVTLIPPANKFLNEENHELVAPRFLNRHHISATHEHVSQIYFAVTENPVLTLPDGVEVSEEIHWFSKDELDDPKWGIQDNVIHYAKSAIGLAGSLGYHTHA